jgi:hypothetical protein
MVTAMTNAKIRRALISVSDKTHRRVRPRAGERGIELLSTWYRQGAPAGGPSRQGRRRAHRLS